VEGGFDDAEVDGFEQAVSSGDVIACVDDDDDAGDEVQGGQG